MRDNFDLQGYLRKNNKLLNEAFEGFGGYRDLTPLKEDNNEVEDLGGWDGDGQHDQYDGEYDNETGPEIVDEADEDNDMMGKKCKECGKGKYIETSQMDDLKGVLHCSNCDHEVERYGLDELQKPEKIYADDEKKSYFVTDDSDDEKGWGNDSAEQTSFDRGWELFGSEIQKVVMNMIKDGYEPEDAVQFLRDAADRIEDGDI